MHSARTLSSPRTGGQDNRTCPRGLCPTISDVLNTRFPVALPPDALMPPTVAGATPSAPPLDSPALIATHASRRSVGPARLFPTDRLARGGGPAHA